MSNGPAGGLDFAKVKQKAEKMAAGGGGKKGGKGKGGDDENDVFSLMTESHRGKIEEQIMKQIEIREGTRSQANLFMHTEESKGAAAAGKGQVKKALAKLDGQEKMTLAELEEELECATERNETGL